MAAQMKVLVAAALTVSALLSVADARPGRALLQGSRTITVHNNCSETIWLAAHTTPGHNLLTEPASPVLPPGGSAAYYTDNNWIGRIWGRTKCGGDPFRCGTADCDGVTCRFGVTGTPPATLAEFAMTQWGGLDFYDVSVVDGFNLPMQIAPSVSSCVTAGCEYDIVATNNCPAPLQQKDSNGAVIGCYNACAAPEFQSSPDLDKYCCIGKYIDADACIAVHPDAYTTAHKQACPLAYSYAYDDANKSLFACAQANYDIYFCGGPGLTKF
ncbi:Pathogenesis-related thaumatin superfamily protein [Klebsormidium nitens]|uniref:Pathogenesis-related thaumatin superfamily protein n=1 Tax=Klebsormidium nitens TaxID=105231 RepID=A0A1Y1I7U3_KLENI|nr:Pathogenesis-related thaumatin superfamily protein [Klebsormidium nitens]|eukprot:GAQ84756.1 Pathogenesis-related thaumatin superfamily protein [Klebsormidium nitens]